MSVVERLVSRLSTVDPLACQEWMGPRNRRGYGLIWAGRTRQAHRVAYELAFGLIPAEMMVCHRCDNPPCCNPSHLFLGDSFANAADMVQKGRSATGQRNGKYTKPESTPRGERHGRYTHPERSCRGERINTARLTDVQAAEIRTRYATGGIRQADLAREFGVNKTTVNRIVRNLSRVIQATGGSAPVSA